MTKEWLGSDWHFGHRNAVEKFTRPDGSPLRAFKSIEEHDEYIIAEHNKRVAPTDRFYFLGDAVINKKYIDKVKLMQGYKILVPGNHDNQAMSVYMELFDEVHAQYGWKWETAIMTHIPIHHTQMERFNLNLHGHLHYNVIEDTRYLNLSMEQIQYAPITIEDAFARVARNEMQYALTCKVINFANEKRNEP